MDASLVLAADFREQKPSNRSFPISDDYRLYFPVDSNGNPVKVGTPGSVPDPREASIDRITSRNDGQAPQNSQTASYDLTVPVGDATEFYSYGMWGHRETTLVWSYREPTNLASLPELYPNGFYPKVRLNERDYDIAGGIRTVVGGWDVDLGTTYGRNRVKIFGFDTLNASFGPGSPTEFDYGSHEQTDWNNSLDITRGYEVGGGHLQVSLGVLHRWERFVIEAGDPLAVAGGPYVFPATDPRAGRRPPPGAQGQTAYLESEASNTSRHNLAGYIDLAYDLTDSLFIGAAVRQEHFTDSAGDATIFKVTGRYEVVPGLAFRGAVNTGFKAPTPGQSAYGNTSSTFATINGVPDTLSLVKFLPVISDAAVALGAEPLVPEKSLSFSAGVTAEPVQGLTLTLDGYVIEVKHRITLTETLRGPAVQAILEANGITTQIDAARYFTNAIDTRTKGIDAVIAYRTPIGETGTLSSTLGFNYNKTKITGVIDNPPELDALGPDYVLFGRAVQGSPLRNPKTKAVWTTSYRNGGLGATVQVTRYGSYQQIATDPADDEIVTGKTITNAELSYDFTDTLSLAVGANNIFNVYPDWVDEPSVNRGNGFYPAGVGYGITGGSYYVRLGVNF
jgi:iron complex outermembrane receptor protein